MSPFLSAKERVAFSFVNNTGQRVRFQQYNDNPEPDKATLKYLRHGGRARLKFDATTTVVINKSVVEVPFDVQQDIVGGSASGSFSGGRGGSSFAFDVGTPILSRDISRERSHYHTNHRTWSRDNKHCRSLTVTRLSNKRGATTSGAHGINIQVSGFNWLSGVPADALGSRFVRMTPRNPAVAEKVHNDWRLDNAVRLVTEVTPFNGGRQLTIRSSFQVQNKTAHPLLMAVNPNPAHKPYNPLGHYKGKASRRKKGKGEGRGEKSEKQVSVCESNLRRTRVLGYNIHRSYVTAAFSSQIDDISEFSRLSPGETYNIPFLLLENALNPPKPKDGEPKPSPGTHLGSLWFRPDQDEGVAGSDDLFSNLMSPGGATTDAATCAIRFR